MVLVKESSTEKMKVLQICKYYYPSVGGIETVAKNISDLLQEKVDMSVLTCKKGPSSITENVHGVNVTRAGSLGSAFSTPISPSFFGMFRKVAKDRDIIHIQSPFPLAEFASIIHKLNGKLMLTWHSDIIKQKVMGKIYMPFLKRTLERADLIVVSAPAMIKNSNILSDYEEKCHIIPLGIDVSPFESSAKMMESADSVRKKYCKKGEKMVLFVGRLVYYKGVKYLIDAAKDVESKIIIVGDGPLKAELNAQASSLGIKDRIIFATNVSNEMLPAYYHACDLFVLPSCAPSEGFGLVQLEAMSCSKPVVSTNLPTAVPWVNQHDISGLIVPACDSNALSEAINRILSDDALRARLGMGARERVLKEFTRAVMADRYYNAYCMLMRRST